MADESIAQRLSALSNNPDIRELRPLFTAILYDITAIKTTIDANVVTLNALTSITSGADVTAAGDLTLLS